MGKLFATDDKGKANQSFTLRHSLAKGKFTAVAEYTFHANEFTPGEYRVFGFITSTIFEGSTVLSQETERMSSITFDNEELAFISYTANVQQGALQMLSMDIDLNEKGEPIEHHTTAVN